MVLRGLIENWLYLEQISCLVVSRCYSCIPPNTQRNYTQ